MPREFEPLPFWFTTPCEYPGRTVTTPWHETEDGVVHFEDKALAVDGWRRRLNVDGTINFWIPVFKDPSVEKVLLPERLRRTMFTIDFRKDASDLVVASDILVPNKANAPAAPTFD